MKKVKVLYCKFCGVKLDSEKKCPSCGKQYFRISVNLLSKIFFLLICASLVCVILIYREQYNNSLKDYQELTKKFLDYQNMVNDKISNVNKLYEEEKKQKEEAIKEKDIYLEKANMLDQNIVFVLTDNNKEYYYTYDCVKKITEGKEYSYIAFNLETAKARGYKEGTCN